MNSTGKSHETMGSVKKQLRFIHEWEMICKQLKEIMKGKDIPIVPKL